MKWCRHIKTKARGYYLAAPYDNIFIGCDPNDGMTRKVADSFDVFINVSDSPCNTFEPSYPGQVMCWYPVNEIGRWNLSYLYWLKKTLDFHHGRGRRIYLHCHAGAYRSPSAAILWLQSRGIGSAWSLKIVGERSPILYEIWKSNGNVPALKDKLFRSMRKHPEWSLAGAMFDACNHKFKDHEIMSGSNRARHLLHERFWFYYKPKWAMKEAWRVFRDWAFKRQGWVSYGIGTYIYPRKHFWSWPRGAEPKNSDETIVYNRRWDSKRQMFVKIRKKT